MQTRAQFIQYSIFVDDAKTANRYVMSGSQLTPREAYQAAFESADYYTRENGYAVRVESAILEYCIPCQGRGRKMLKNRTFGAGKCPTCKGKAERYLEIPFTDLQILGVTL